MLRRGLVGLAWVSVVAAMVGFFIPWASIRLEAPGWAAPLGEVARSSGAVDRLRQGLGKITVTIQRGTETITGELPSLSDLPTQVSGAQIPQLVQGERAKVAIALFELFTGGRQHLGLKSYAVYGLPGLALLFGLLLTCRGDRRVVAAGVASASAVIAGLGLWKLLTVNPEALFVAITIGPGLWVSVGAYIGLAIAGGLCAIRS
ncbi:MAG: hypothetical protein Q8R91_10480 [Candidatus Omnitrophota bacterium]|nr:hypothetical protein [Candidatus Omnitrophota bacterium]